MRMLDPFQTCMSMKVNMLALENMFTIKQMKNLNYNDVDNVHSKEATMIMTMTVEKVVLWHYDWWQR